MIPPLRTTLPSWLAPFCCVIPFCALIALSMSALCGAPMSTPGLICLVLLCGKITGWVLNVQPQLPKQGQVDSGR